VIDLPIVGARTALVTLVSAAAAAGCGRGHHETAVEAELRRAVSAAIGPVQRVHCDGPTRCTASLGAGDHAVSLPIAVHDDGAELVWELDGLVADGKRLADEVGARLAEHELVAGVDCGPATQLVHAGDVITCEIRDARRDGAVAFAAGRAWARIAADGTAELELALGSDAVTARTQSVGADDLDQLSRALDRDDPGVDDDDGDDDGGADANRDAAVATDAGP